MKRTKKLTYTAFALLLTAATLSSTVKAESGIVASLKQQESEDGKNIRYIATVSNVLSLSQIKDFDVNVTITGSTTVTNKYKEDILYTSVKNQAECAKVDNTYYGVFILGNVNSYIGSTINVSYTFNLNDNTKVTTNALSYTVTDNTKALVYDYAGCQEGAYVQFECDDPLKASVYYKASAQDTYTKLDSELILKSKNGCRADVLGLKAGEYNMYVVVNDGKTSKESNILNVNVSSQDRSGYAQFDQTAGVGAYNTDGTLKSNADVIYVSNATKNTVTYKMGGKTYTGLSEILANSSNASNPLDIRILDTITTNQWKPKSCEPRLADNSNLQTDTFWKNEFETTYGENLAGLTIKYMDKYEKLGYTYKSTASGLAFEKTGASSQKITTYSGSEYSNISGKTVYDDDSYWNMLDIVDASNITVEGVGENAGVFQWGFTWSNANSIEIKNLEFTDYPEDACSFEGSSLSAGSSKVSYKAGGYWVHNNSFNRGKNNWDVSGERDKYAGDGATDFKSVKGITSAYNRFNNCKKTGLVGSGDSVLTMDVTFHHNFYNEVGSRLPLGRQANMHFYNNYYYKCSTAQDIRANAFVLSESNYFDNCPNAQLVKTDSTYTKTAIKSYNDILVNCSNSQATKVSSRTESISGSCKPDNSTNYTNFDTNAQLFYYDSVNKVSKVQVMKDANDVPAFVRKYAGAHRFNYLESTAVDNSQSGESGGSESGSGSQSVTSTVTIDFNSLTKGQYTSSVSAANYKILATSSKTINVNDCNETVNGVAVTKYIALGGSGNKDYRNINITLAKKANVTIYYNGGSSTSTRYIQLIDDAGNVVVKDPNGSNSSTIDGCIFTSVASGTYGVVSAGSGLNVYLIVIEYLE